MEARVMSWEPRPFAHSSVLMRFLLQVVCVFAFSIGIGLTAKCTRLQACKASLSSFPLIEEESSGWGGSGMVPLYDEFLETAPFDYSITPDIENFDLCECDGENSCETSEETSLKLDETLTMTFCEPIETALPMTCRGRRGFNRVIGRAHSSGKTISTVTSTMFFCSCPNGYQRLAPEMWAGSDLAMSYKCL